MVRTVSFVSLTLESVSVAQLPTTFLYIACNSQKLEDEEKHRVYYKGNKLNLREIKNSLDINVIGTLASSVPRI